MCPSPPPVLMRTLANQPWGMLVFFFDTLALYSKKLHAVHAASCSPTQFIGGGLRCSASTEWAITTRSRSHQKGGFRHSLTLTFRRGTVQPSTPPPMNNVLRLYCTGFFLSTSACLLIQLAELLTEFELMIELAEWFMFF